VTIVLDETAALDGVSREHSYKCIHVYVSAHVYMHRYHIYVYIYILFAHTQPKTCTYIWAPGVPEERRRKGVAIVGKRKRGSMKGKAE